MGVTNSFSASLEHSKRVQGIQQASPHPYLPLDGRIIQAIQMLQLSEVSTPTGARLTQQISEICDYSRFIRQSFAAFVYANETDTVLEFVDSLDSHYEIQAKNRLACLSRLNFLEGGRFEIKVANTEQQATIHSRISDAKSVVVKHKAAEHRIDASKVVSVSIMSDEDMNWLQGFLKGLQVSRPENVVMPHDESRTKATSSTRSEVQNEAYLFNLELIFGRQVVLHALEVAYYYAQQTGQMIRRRIKNMEEAADEEAELIRWDVLRREIRNKEIAQYEQHKTVDKERLITTN